MSGIFMACLLLLVAGFATLLGQGAGTSVDPCLARVAQVTRLPGLALSASYLEPGHRALEDGSEVVHPGLPPLSYLDFVYAP